MKHPGYKTLLIGERMLLLLECPSEEKLTSYLLWIVIPNSVVLIVIWFDMMNDIPTISFRTKLWNN